MSLLPICLFINCNYRSFMYFGLKNNLFSWIQGLGIFFERRCWAIGNLCDTTRYIDCKGYCLFG